MIFDYLNLSYILFVLSIMGIILNSKNMMIILMAMELMLLSINFCFVSFSVFFNDIWGQMFCLFVLTVAASESAMGLSILVAYYSLKGSMSVMFMNLMKG